MKLLMWDLSQRMPPSLPPANAPLAVGRISKGSDATPVAVFNPALEKALVKIL